MKTLRLLLSSKALAFLFGVVLLTETALAENQGAETETEASARVHLDADFSSEIEAKLARLGGPSHIRSGATVYVYRRGTGFTLHAQGSNGFTCMLNRDAFLYGAKAFKPTCWDEVGENSYVPVMLSVGRWLAEGLTTPEVRARIEAGFQGGQFQAPRRSGIAYMVAGDLDLDIESGSIIRTLFPGHHMYYAPYVTNDQLGVDLAARAADQSLPRVFTGGAGGIHLAYIISMVGHAKRGD